MKQESIDQLLERYWRCETSIEEEKQLRAFFSGDNVPERLKKYRSLFVWEKKQAEVKSQKPFKVQAKRSLTVRFYPVMKVAAVVLLLLTVGIGAYTHYQQEKFMDKVFSETYSDPEEAMKETGKVIAKVSSILSRSQDSLVVKCNNEEIITNEEN